MIRLLAVEPDDRYWRALQTEVSTDPRFGEVRRAQDAEEAIQGLDGFRPSMAVVDLTLPALQLLNLLQRLATSNPPAGVVGTADVLDDGRVAFALSAGVAACLPRSAQPRQVAVALMEVAAGGRPIHREVAARPQLLGRVISEFQRRSRGAASHGTPCPLTPRERTILDMVAGGHANKEIGVALVISERTVKNHMTNILSKLMARDRAHAVRIGMENAWIGQRQWTGPDGLGVAA